MKTTIAEKIWFLVAPVSEFPEDGGTCAKVGDQQIAVFHFSSRNEWFACDNSCPHTGDMVLARGLIGDSAGEPKVACPLHKRNFSLRTGECLTGETYKIRTYPVIIEEGLVYIEIDAPLIDEHKTVKG
ncbi:nitrite reductase [NAD(P)H], small subunit [Leptospira fainei serovar Hurstbridge str. BUT 6]|uniref:Nitrite reductase [NAD(P)H], small subunit n=1 Tax=Leptospira fainei serovar Hurstbridge str. BUT 6 TaxID=1193011 RepID=S3VWH7_9LEPT|nr:nitrite reductase small subunit NirD [Leptospira fainei]EPG72477.1 nitrite reductase [NAD(P)H], small subunit [Leptospira fainei serovar Hurstbridge str. BUT 6]